MRPLPATQPVSTAVAPATATAAAARFACFDGLRAMAALMVIGVHTAFVSGFTIRSGLGRYTARMDAGVEVFFVISGFLLYRRFAVAHLKGAQPPGTVEFWKRRLRRIIPAYWLAFLFISYVMGADTVRHSWEAPLVYLGFAQIYFPHYILTGITQAWSLCTEMTFYLFVPLYAATLGRKPRGQSTQVRLEAIGVATLLLSGFAYRVAIHSIHAPIAATMPNWLPGYVDQFGIGMGLAVASAWVEVTATRPRWLWHPYMPWVAWTLAGACFLAVGNLGLPLSPLGNGSEAASLAKQALYGAFGFFVVVPAVFGRSEEGPIRRLLRARVIVAVGVVSYGVYLWHQAWLTKVLSWSNARIFHISLPLLAASVTGLALVSAAASYLIVEKPILQKGWPLVGSRILMIGRAARIPNFVASPADESARATGFGRDA